MDKLEFLDALLGRGFDAALFNNGIPTVFVESAENISTVSKDLKAIVKETAYTQSFGVALTSRKSA